MKHHLPHLESLKAFESAARHLSFSLAADELCLTKSAVSYQIRKLEEQLQKPLFRRSVRQVYLTNSGQELLQTTTRFFKEMKQTLDRFDGENQHAGISIAVSTYVAARWLSSRMSDFNVRFPNVYVLLQHSVNEIDFKLNDVDLAIRWGPSRDKRDAGRLGEIPMALYPALSPVLMNRHNLDAQEMLKANIFEYSEIQDIPLLCEDRSQDLWKEWFDSCGLDKNTVLKNPRRIISDANVRVQAAIDGQGLILADDLMKNEIRNGLLLAPFDKKLEGYGYVFMSSRSRIFSENAKQLKRWLISELHQES